MERNMDMVTTHIGAGTAFGRWRCGAAYPGCWLIGWRSAVVCILPMGTLAHKTLMGTLAYRDTGTG